MLDRVGLCPWLADGYPLPDSSRVLPSVRAGLRCVLVLQNFLLLQGTSQIGVGPTVMTSFDLKEFF